MKIASIMFSLVILAGTVFGDERSSLRFIVTNNPVTHPEKTRAGENIFSQTSELKLIGSALVRFYQVFISPQDIPSCPFSPTCSEYAKLAIAKYGLLAGCLMAADRYSRCNGLSARFYPVDASSNRLIDPPERNLP
jgi:putative membrane protein insertion efficiency factor